MYDNSAMVVFSQELDCVRAYLATKAGAERLADGSARRRPTKDAPLARTRVGASHHPSEPSTATLGAPEGQSTKASVKHSERAPAQEFATIHDGREHELVEEEIEISDAELLALCP